MDNRPQWGTRAGFILAAVGSAIGLGNIWRFPAVAYENGGGAFFLPYLFALLTAGIPLLIMEFTIGHKYRGSAPLSYARMGKRKEWIGWWQVAISFVISTYYAVIVAWAISYTVFSFNLGWGKDTENFLMTEYLNRVDIGGGAIGQFGGFVPGVLIPLAIVWIVSLGILFAGVKKGIEIANRIFIPLLLVLFLIIVIYSITLDGAAQGLNAFFTPDWSQITNGKVWVAAYGQIFFSLSIAFAIMITYSSYLPKKSDITNNAFITGFGNSSFELLAGIGVFSALGFMAAQQGVPVKEVVSSGIGLAFVVFPQIINEFPAFNVLFGFLFFGSLVFATKGGLFFLDAADYFINNFGVALAGLIEVVAIAWFAKELKALQAHANSVSDIQLGAWWRICLSVVTPIVLGYMMFDNIKTNITTAYGDLPVEFLLKWGWCVAVGAIAAGFILSLSKWKNELKYTPFQHDKEVSS